MFRRTSHSIVSILVSCYPCSSSTRGTPTESLQKVTVTVNSTQRFLLLRHQFTVYVLRVPLLPFILWFARKYVLSKESLLLMSLIIPYLWFMESRPPLNSNCFSPLSDTFLEVTSKDLQRQIFVKSKKREVLQDIVVTVSLNRGPLQMNILSN